MLGGDQWRDGSKLAKPPLYKDETILSPSSNASNHARRFDVYTSSGAAKERQRGAQRSE